MSGADDATFCALDVRERDFERYALTLFVAPAHRRALLALFAFNAEVSRVRDMVSQPLPGEIRLQWWADALAGKEHGEAGGNPIAAELLRAIEACGLPRGMLDHSIEAHRFDLYDDPMPSLRHLEAYADKTDGTVLTLGARVLGATSAQAEALARDAGVALGIMRAIDLLPLHASRRQLYLPIDLVEQYQVRIEDVFAGTVTPTLRELIAHLHRVAKARLDAAMGPLPSLSPAARPAFLQLALLRRQLAAGVPTDPFRMPERSRLRTLWTMWRARV
ncbi:MAG: phytoene/squalene synthase family protein [Pseudomonadota bacterium]